MKWYRLCDTQLNEKNPQYVEHFNIWIKKKYVLLAHIWKNLLIKQTNKTDRIASRKGTEGEIFTADPIVRFEFLVMSIYYLFKILSLLGGYEFRLPVCDLDKLLQLSVSVCPLAKGSY